MKIAALTLFTLLATPLCYAMDPAPSSIKFPSFFAAATANHSTIAANRDTILHNKDQYLEEMDDAHAFTGLYLKGQYERALDDGEGTTQYGIEWELYEDGLNESKVTFEKKKIESQVQYFQLLNNMREKEIGEDLYQLQTLTFKTHQYIESEKLSYLEDQQEAIKQRLDTGFITRGEYEQRLQQYLKVKTKAEFLHSYAGIHTDHKTLEMLNRIEWLQLASSTALEQLATNQSYDLKLQQLFIQRTEFFPKWNDEFSLRLYLERRQRSDAADDNVAGIRVRVPLRTNDNRDTLIRLEQQAYQEQLASITTRIVQRIHRLAELIRFHQSRVKTLTMDNSVITKWIELTSEYRDQVIPSLEHTPDKSLHGFRLQQLDKRKEILLARLKTYEFVLKLNNLVMPTAIDNLFTE